MAELKDLIDLAALSETQIIDMLGEYNEARKEFEEKERLLKQLLKERLSDGAHSGTQYMCSIESRSQIRLDGEKIREDMPGDRILQHSKVSEFRRVSQKRLGTTA